MLGTGILKAFVGLSGSVFTTVYVGAFKPSMGAFMLFLALGPPALGLLGLALVNHVAPDARPGGKWAGRTFLSAAAGGMPDTKSLKIRLNCSSKHIMLLNLREC